MPEPDDLSALSTQHYLLDVIYNNPVIKGRYMLSNRKIHSKMLPLGSCSNAIYISTEAILN